MTAPDPAARLRELVARTEGHTPGPWVAFTDDGEDSWEVVDHRPGETHWHEVAIRDARSSMRVSDPEKANMRAIAALPELREAAVWALGRIEELAGALRVADEALHDKEPSWLSQHSARLAVYKALGGGA